MKLFAWVVFGLTSSVCRAETSSMGETALATFRETFVPVDLRASASLFKIPSSAPEDSAPVQLDSMTVTASLMRKMLAKAINERAAAEADKMFSWKQGGLISTKKIGKIDADFGLWMSLGSTLTEKVGTQDIMLRIDVLHLRW